MTDEITQEELDSLRASAAKLAEMEPELQKLKEKDMNFENLRKAKEGSDKKVEVKETEIQRLTREQEEKFTKIEADNRKWREDQFAEQKDSYFKNLCGDDADLKAKIEFEMGNLIGEVNTPTQLQEKMSKAYLLVKGSRPSVSAFGKMGTTAGPSNVDNSGKDFTDTAEGNSILNKITRGQVDWSKQPKRTSYFN